MPMSIKVMFAMTLFFVFAACKKDHPYDLPKNDNPSLFWVQAETINSNAFNIVKGIHNASASQSVYTLYHGIDNHYTIILATNRGTKDLFWTDVYVKKTPRTRTVSNIVRGDTLGLSADTIYRVESAIDAMVINPVNRKIYWAEYDSTSRRDSIFCSNLDGSNKMNLYATTTLKRICQLSFDSPGTTLYFLQSFYGDNSSVLETSEAWKGNANGTGTPVLLYGKKDFPQSLATYDLLTGIAVKGSDLYIASQSQAEGGNGMCYLVKGSTDGTATLTTILSSTPTAATNPLKMIMNLQLDKEEKYLYWLNQGMPDNGSTGSIYRLPLATPNKPELLLSNIAVAPWLLGYLGLGQ